MTADNFAEVLHKLQKLAPFRPFTVEYVSGDRIEVDRPDALVIRGGITVYVSSRGQLSIFDHESVSHIIDSSGQRAA